LAVAGYMSGSDTSLGVTGSSANLDALLNKLRWMVEPSNFDWVNTPYRKKQANSWAKSVKSSSRYPDTWADRYAYSAVFSEDHALGYWMRPDDYIAMVEWDIGMLKDWIYNKWQPANAELLVVGRVDPKEAEATIRQYFESWKYAGEGEPSQIGTLPIPATLPDRTVYLFDKPTATQTQVDLKCQLDSKDQFDDLARSQVVGDVLSQIAWRKLREEAGVTYGAGAYTRVWDGGTGMLMMSSLVQNDATAFAVQTMLDIVEMGSKGDVKEQGIADAKLTRAREYVLNQQSGAQMISRLSNTGIENFGFFEKYAANLAAVNKDDFVNLMSKCQGHEVVTVVGPLSNAESQLKEKGIEYTVVNWEEERRGLLTEKERAKEDKAKAKAEKKAAKNK